MAAPLKYERAISFDEAAQQMRDGDLLNWLHGSGFSRLIAIGGRGEYSHSAMACFRGVPGEWLAVEMLQFAGGRAQPLAEQVARYPGRIDWFRANAGDRWHEWRPALAVESMLALLRKPYGWWNLLWAGCRHMAVIRLFCPPITDDRLNGNDVPFCSQAVAAACRAGGVDPVPSLADRLTEPCDLARSLFFHYEGTLIP